MAAGRRTAGPAPQGATYEVRLEGSLEGDWAQWLAGLALRGETQADGRIETVIILPYADAARLHGLLAHIGALNLTLISVKRMDGSQ